MRFNLTKEEMHDHLKVKKAALISIAINVLEIVAGIVMLTLVRRMLLGGVEESIVRMVSLLCFTIVGWGALTDIGASLTSLRMVRRTQELEEAYSQLEDLNREMRAQRHDFLNHLQVVYSLMEMGEYQDATAYLETVYSQLHAVSRVLRTKVTAFNALLQVKNAECERRGIALEMDVRSTLEGIAMPAWELCCVIGNLLDNAMDAAAQAEKPQITLSVTESLREFTFIIRNNGAAIPASLRERIFEPGFSTKGENRGMGLAIVRRRLEEYGGRLLLESGGEATVFTVFLPHGNGLAPKTE